MRDKVRWVIAAILVVIILLAVGLYVLKAQGFLVRNRQNVDSVAHATAVQVSLSGRVLSVSEDSLVILPLKQETNKAEQVRDKSSTIGITHKTRFEETIVSETGFPERRSITRQEIRKNDIVSVDATLSQGGVLAGVLVIVSPRPDAKGVVPTGGYTGGTVINGIVDNVIEGGFSVNSENGEILAVAMGPGVRVMVASQNHKSSDGSVADIKAGMKISVMGIRMASGKFEARQVMCVR
jgi:hypothetical protein